MQLFCNKQFMVALDASRSVVDFTFAKFGFILGYVIIKKTPQNIPCSYTCLHYLLYMYTPSISITAGIH